MRISHVIRGEDHLSNTSKHVDLYHALGVTPPQYAHLPLILKDPKMGQGKMSKRDRGALIEEYQQRHFLPAAVRNAIALLGRSPGGDREVMDIGEIIEAFDIRQIQKGAARFDEAKMNHINFQYLKALPVETYAWFARPVLAGKGLLPEPHDEDYLQRVLALCQDKITSLEALPEFCAYFFTDDFPADPKTAEKLAKKGDPRALAAAHGEEKPFRWWPVTRFALSGSGPDFLPMLEVLGRDTVLRRLARL